MATKKFSKIQRALQGAIIYYTLQKSLVMGLIRVRDAQIGFLLATRFFIEHKGKKRRSGELEVPDDFDRGAFEYVITASLVVYCVSLFDVFLSDITRALLFNNIAALGKSCLIPIEVLASQEARIEIIKKEVEKRVRNTGYKSFEERLEFLRTTFALSFNLKNEEHSMLKRLSDLRNRLVHDQSLHLFNLDRYHRPSIRSKKSPKRAVPVAWGDIDDASDLFLALGRRIVQSIRMGVVKELPEEMRAQIKAKLLEAD